MENNSISVTQFCTYIKQIFDAEELLHGISIYGEVSGFSLIRGNAYFTIKDETASLSCVFFGYVNTPLTNGEKIIVVGSPSFYAKSGKLNFNVFKINQVGKGELYLQFLLMKEKLEKEGLFDVSKKRPLPKNIQKIGVVTSKEGAVLQDIINVVSRRNPFAQLVVYPARVQGQNAQKTIIDGIKSLNKTDVDVIVVARGGGSAEDLACFNDEALARQVASSKKVIVSAVGHEVDFTIIDFVSDVRASTPSVAAELVTSDMMAVFQKIQTNKTNLTSKIWSFLTKKSFDFDNKIIGVANNFEKLTRLQKIKLESQKQTVLKQIFTLIRFKQEKFLSNSKVLTKLNPKNLLQLGYVKVEQNGIALNSVKQIDNNCFDIIFKDGKIKAKRVEN